MSLFSYIKSNLPILDVIREYVSLKQAGSYWKGPCPFHNETDASFTVSPDKGIFYCFGCHSGGDVISFIAKTENMPQLEAAQHIVERFGLKVPEEILKEIKSSAADTEKKNDYFSLCQAVAEWTHQQLLEDKAARDYLTSRKVTQAEIDYFTIGYFKGGLRAMNAFTKFMASKNILVKDLLEVGILIQGRSVTYSPFEERILFPIKDALGRFCGFGGRVFKPADERAKYYNSRESAWFSKGKLLFGLDLAKKEMQQKTRAFLVEGYTDCVAMVAAGHKNTIATLGTACTSDHLKLLSRYISTLYVLYDGDRAGQKAILRLTALCWDVNLELRVVVLPPDDDPATYLQKGGDIGQLAANARDIFSFYTESLSDDFYGKPLAHKLELAHKIIEVIANLSDSFKQDLLLQQAAVIMQLPFDSLKKLLHQIRARKTSSVTKTEEKEPQQESSEHNEFQDISELERNILLSFINGFSLPEPLTIDEELVDCLSPVVKEIVRIGQEVIAHKGKHDRFQALLDSLPANQQSWVMEQSVAHEITTQKEFKQLLAKFRKENWKVVVRNLKIAILRAKQVKDTKKLEKLLNQFVELQEGIRSKGLV